MLSWRHLSVTEGDEGDVWIDYGHCIGVGLSWEDGLITETLDAIGNACEQPSAQIVLDPLALPGIVEVVKLLAKARGLIRLAEIISIPSRGQNNECTFFGPDTLESASLMPVTAMILHGTTHISGYGQDGGVHSRYFCF